MGTHAKCSGRKRWSSKKNNLPGRQHHCLPAWLQPLHILQERRKAEEEEAAEAEAAAKVKAAQLREKVRQANQKAVARMEKLRTEGRASREAANAAVLDAVRWQASTGMHPARGRQHKNCFCSFLWQESCCILVCVVVIMKT